MAEQPEKWAKVFVFGAVADEGEYGYIEKIDLAKPFPYYIVRDTEKEGAWYRREQFRFEHGKLSARQALDKIEIALQQHCESAVVDIENIIEQYKNGK